MEEIIPEGEERNDHYVPQLLLRRFCGADGRLAVYDRNSAQVETRKSVPKRSASAEGWDRYLVGGEARETSYREIENDFGTLLANQLAMGSLLGTPQTRVQLRRFVASQIARSPRYRQRVELLTSEHSQYLDQVNVSEGFRRKLQQEHSLIFDPENNGWAASEIGAAHYARIYMTFYNHRITIARAHPDHRLHIGDSPVTPFTGDPVFPAKASGGLWMNPNLVLSLPISSEFTLLTMGPGFLRALQDIGTSGMYMMKDVTANDVLDSFHTGRAFQLGEQGTICLNQLQDTIAVEKIYSAEKSDFDPVPGSFEQWKSGWRRRIDERRPAAEVIAELEDMGRSYTRKRARLARVQDAPLSRWSMTRLM